MTTLKKFTTARNESFKTTLLRWGLNLFPAYLGTGANISFLSEDFQEVHVRIPYNWRTRDSLGKIFGGSLYGAVDPVYTMILRRNLDDSFRIKEAEANVRFLKPAKTDLFGRMVIENEELERIRDELTHHDSVTRVYSVDLVDDTETVYARVDKTFTITRPD
ncbi:MAG: PaaI family thioesterase [bacterium]